MKCRTCKGKGYTGDTGEGWIYCKRCLGAGKVNYRAKCGETGKHENVIIFDKDDKEYYLCIDCKTAWSKQKCEVYSRVVGYLRPVSQWNDGKTQEFRCRKPYDINGRAIKTSKDLKV